MIAQYIQAGDRIDHTPTADLAAGDVVVLGDLVGVATGDTPANTPGTLTVEGVVSVPVQTPGDWSVGDTAYWDEANNRADPSAASGANKAAGKCVGVDAANSRIALRLSN